MLQVDHLAKKMNTGSSSGAADNSMQLEQLTCTNREQAAKIQSLSQAAAQREALIGQLQAQLATVRLHEQQFFSAMTPCATPSTSYWRTTSRVSKFSKGFACVESMTQMV